MPVGRSTFRDRPIALVGVAALVTALGAVLFPFGGYHHEDAAQRTHSTSTLALENVRLSGVPDEPLRLAPAAWESPSETDQSVASDEPASQGVSRDATSLFAELQSEARDERERLEMATFLRWTRVAGQGDPDFGSHGPCPADLDSDGGASPGDLVTYFDAFDRGESFADFDLDGEVTSADIAAFLVEYDRGCDDATHLSVEHENLP